MDTTATGRTEEGVEEEERLEEAHVEIVTP
jgi:hypothetical protein